jgi:predicted NUDIX family NTP pyrophosphohydrolase
MKKTSAGLLVYRIKGQKLEVMLAHMGAPWWAGKDKGAWTIPKGEYTDEEPLAAAKREFVEELNLPIPKGDLIELGIIEQKNKKSVTAWAVEADIDVSNIKSNTFKTEWPPRSGKFQEFPEIDKAGWFTQAEAMDKMIAGQGELIERLAAKLSLDSGQESPKQEKLL